MQLNSSIFQFHNFRRRGRGLELNDRIIHHFVLIILIIFRIFILKISCLFHTLATTTTTTTVDPRLALNTTAEQLLAEIQSLLQAMQNYNGTKTGVPPFISNSTALLNAVQSLITNMMNSSASNDSTTLANLENLATQESAAWAAYVASDTTTTSTTTTTTSNF